MTVARPYSRTEGAGAREHDAGHISVAQRLRFRRTTPRLYGVEVTHPCGNSSEARSPSVTRRDDPDPVLRAPQHPAFIADAFQKAMFREQRARRFQRGRLFPALVVEDLLRPDTASPRRRRGALTTKSIGAMVPTVGGIPFAQMTISNAVKAKPKFKYSTEALPFVPPGSGGAWDLLAPCQEWMPLPEQESGPRNTRMARAKEAHRLLPLTSFPPGRSTSSQASAKGFGSYLTYRRHRTVRGMESDVGGAATKEISSGLESLNTLVRGLPGPLCGGTGGVLKALDLDMASRTSSKQSSLQKKTKHGIDKSDIHRKCKWIFKKLASHGRLAREDLGMALILTGIRKPNDELIEDAIVELHKEPPFSYEEFMQFETIYAKLQAMASSACFEAIDVDRSGIVEYDELPALLLSLGFDPMPHVLKEIIEEVDEDRSGGLDMYEFLELMEMLTTREGFGKEEYKEILDFFKKFDVNHSGCMKSQELPIAIDWLGFKVPEAEMRELILEIDADRSGTIEEFEWLFCMRRLRERTLANLKRQAAQSDMDGSGTICFEELTDLFQHLGYLSSPDVLRACCLDAGLNPNEELQLAELWMTLKAYREREGLSPEEVKDVDGCFKMVDRDDAGVVPAQKVGQMVRSMGYTLSYDVQQQLILKVDIDGSKELDLREFRKMIRYIMEMEHNLHTMAFYEFGHEFGERIPLHIAQAALRHLGCVGHDDQVIELHEDEVGTDGTVNVRHFCKCAARSRAQARESFKQNGGFSASEIMALQALFSVYDLDGNGALAGHEVYEFVENEMPSLWHNAEVRPQIKQLLDELLEQDGTIKFVAFVRLMHLIKDLKEQLRIQKEIAVIHASKLSPSEVDDFRNLFGQISSDECEVRFESLRELLSNIAPMGHKNEAQLRELFDKNALPRLDELDGRVDFPGFLWLMHELLETDWAGISAEYKSPIYESVRSEHMDDPSDPLK